MGGGRGNAGYGRRTAALSCLTVVGSAHPPGIIVDEICSGLIIRPRNESQYCGYSMGKIKASAPINETTAQVIISPSAENSTTA